MKLEPEGSFEDQVDMLFKELELAVQWQRPSILLVSYPSRSVRLQARRALEKRLAEIGQELVTIPVNEKRFDLPLHLSRRHDREHTVYSVSGLSRGGGKEAANTYRALNIRREFFVDYRIRAVFWLTEEELVALTQHAPDFWAFRHLVLEFEDPSRRES